MSQHINLLAFGTFGSPNGFTQSFFYGDNNLARSIKTFDLKTDAIKLYPDVEIFGMRKEPVNGNTAVSYSKYSFAKEPNSDRAGTFIGSSILFLNKLASESDIISCLNEFHENLVVNNVQNGVIKVNHSDKLEAIKLPAGFDALIRNVKELEHLNLIQTPNKSLVVYCLTSSENLQVLFNKAVDLLGAYETIYFTQSTEVVEFVLLKAMFPLVKEDGFEREIQNLIEEQKQKTQFSINEFESEKQRFEADRKRVIAEYELWILQNDQLHQENGRRLAESKQEYNQINQKYDAFARKIDEAINHLRSGQKLEKVREQHHQNKKAFIDSVNNQTPLIFTKIPKRQAKTELKTFVQHPAVPTFEHYPSTPEAPQGRKSKSGFFKKLSLFFFILWVGTLLFFIFSHTLESDEVEPKSYPQHVDVPIVDPNIEPALLETKLSPTPNMELNENDCKAVARKVSKNMSLAAIVQIIFDANPTDIGRSYSTQPDDYGKLLFEKNRDCFSEDSSQAIFLNDTLWHIPAYKN